MANAALSALSQVGTSTWLDDLSRQRLSSGDLAELIKDYAVVGVTTNPAIFSSAMTAGEDYDEQLAELAKGDATPAEAVFDMAIDDVRNACDLFDEVYEATDGADGRVSIEVDPRLADDYDATITQARQLWQRVGKRGAMIKIPATDASLPAVSDAIAEGISVNVTLIFSVGRYEQVVDAFLTGLERAKAAEIDLSTIHSVASLFVSRVDTEIDSRLEEIGSEEALALRGKAGLANARAAYAHFEEVFSETSERWARLAADGAHPQRLLWASTGVKNPAYADTLYVTELAAPRTVNTMPEKTLRAAAAFEGDIVDAVSGQGAAAQEVINQLYAVGIDIADVFEVLEREGVEKFVDSWNGLLESIKGRMEQLKAQ